MGHIYGAYMTVGLGEASVNLTGLGQTWQWALLWNGIALTIVFRPVYGRIELLFKFFLVLLSICFLGTALWVGPNPAGILEGVFAFKLPPKSGPYDARLILIGMIGAVGGSLMNLVYPYFLEGKGWNGPQYRRVQMYDFLLAMIVMIILNLAVWTLGAELLHPQGLALKELDDFPHLLSQVIGARTSHGAAIIAIVSVVTGTPGVRIISS